MKEIESFSIARLMAGQLYNFHALTVKQITKSTPAALHVEEFFDEYKTTVDTLKKINEATAFLPYTAVLEEYDRRRDYLLQRVLKTADEMMRDPDKIDSPVQSNASRIIASYAGIQKQEMNKESSKIDALLAVIDKEQIEVLIDEYGGHELVTALRAANEMFKANMNQRNEGMGELESFDRPAVRRRANELYRRMRKRINAYAEVAPTQSITDFIDVHNGLVREYKHIESYLQYGGSENEKVPPRPKEDERDDELIY